jgi:dATP pyrophosphohydrolase
LEPAQRSESVERTESPFRRPESVLIVIYTAAGEFLLLERVRPPGFWQSVTGSIEWGEMADDAARREVIEETGITQGLLRNLQWTQVYEILPSFGKKYAPGITRNLEHAFALKLLRRVPVTLSPREHVRFRWAPAGEALETVSSSTNRAIIQQLRH